MIKRYSTDRMNQLWQPQSKFNAYLRVELAALQGLVKLKIVPKADFDLINKTAKINLKKIVEIEAVVKHDVIAFTRSISEQLGPEKKWIHYGLTSSDIIDTANALLIQKANDYIRENLFELQSLLKQKALKYKKTLIIGRTHGVHAEITSFGLKWALWYDELKRNIIRFNLACTEIETGKISGPVGNYSSTFGTKLQDFVCLKLEINSSLISTQVIQRDIYANYIFNLTLISNFLGKIATEFRNLQRTEINEVQEFFTKNQKGSSSMPHKQNPIASENMVGIARLFNGYTVSTLENIPLWHERDISHSSVERVIIPDATNLIDYSLTRFIKVIDELVVNEDRMLQNINLTYGVIYSQQVMNKLLTKQLSRETVYDLIQPIAFKAYNEKINFKDLLAANGEISKHLTLEELAECFDSNYYLKYVEEIYNRVF